MGQSQETTTGPHYPTIDFETYSEAGYVWSDAEQKWRGRPGYPTKRGLEVVGVDNYTAHPSFRPLSLCYDLRDGRGVQRWVPPVDLFKLPPGNFDPAYGEHPWPLLHHIAAGGIVEAHHVGFEHYVWQWCVRNWGWPAWPLEQQRCSAAKARANAYPGGLAELGEVLGIANQKDAIGKRLIRKLTVPKNPTKKSPALRWTPETAPVDFEAFYGYNEQDVRAECEASGRLPELTPHELRVWLLDQRVNRRGMGIDRAGVENCIAIVEQATARACVELRQLTNNAVQAPTEVAAMCRWIEHRIGWPLTELDEETVRELLKRTDFPLDVQRVLRIRQQLALGSVKKLYAMREQTGVDGRLRDQYIYHGAHTSLWNGRGVQPANLPRPMHERFEKIAEVERALQIIACRSIELLEYEYPGLDPLEIVASCLRSLIVAAPGYRLISADFNAIQAVVTSALAGEEWRLEVFRTHGKIYETMASRLTGVALEQYLAFKRETGKHHADRQLGKLAVLSADFGAWINGWKRFGADKLLGSDENIKALILKTRAAQPMVGELWGGQTRDRFTPDERPELHGLEGAVVAALLEPGQAFGYRGIVYQVDVTDGTLHCMPPSGFHTGGTIKYHNARLRPSQRPYARPWEYEITYEGWNSNAQKGAPGWQTMTLYGGVLTQNVVSHESREIQALALLRLEERGYPVVMHTHDENVTEVPDGFGSAAEHTALTGELPVWARTPDGLPWPIKVPDSWEAPRYGKW